ncbi:MAG: hypothetical protein HFH03_11520 [Dorea sp.]|jgi:hypothetical protein|nr:hypothetical protein [Dorea sp.]
MAGKIRYIAALAAVLGLIYVQQSSVTYAVESNSGKSNVIDKETEVLTEGEDKPPGEGEDKLPEEGEDKLPEEGEDKLPEEGEDKLPEEGEDKPPEEGEDKPPEGGEDKTPGEGEDKPPEEKKVMEGYKIDIPKINGKRGYYIKKPEITICHMSEVGVTKYCLKHGDNKLDERTLKEKGERAVITEKTFSEGKNILHVWMEDEEGKRLNRYELKKEFLIDTKPPEIVMSVPKGFDTWYQDQVTLSAVSEDSGSGVEKISGLEGDRDLGSISKKQGRFVISRPSVFGKGVDVTITAEDRAGNKSERIKTVFVDKAAPDITITGAKDYMITGRSVKLSCEISEENRLQEFYAQTVWKNVKGRKKQLSSAEWKDSSKGKILTQTLKNDGIYHVKVQAKDMSGHISMKEMQIIVDKTDPVIRYIETLDGQHLKKFKWEYPFQQMIHDFTTYVYEMRLDGRLYHMGETIRSEGKHKVTVKAADAAGNKAQASAEFVIDHTAPEIIFHNVEGGQEYEEERTFKVGLAKKEDEVRQILINGKNQKIGSKRTSYEYRLHECKDYEVTVKAADKAGNESVKSLFFTIVPKKSLMKRITEPIKIQWNMGKKADAKFSKEAGKGEWEESSRPVPLKAAGFIMFVSIMIVTGILYVKILHKKDN